MDDHDPRARGDVEMGRGGQPKPTVTISWEIDDAALAQAVVIEIPAVSGNSIGSNRPQIDNASPAIGNPGAAAVLSACVLEADPRCPDEEQMSGACLHHELRESPQATDSNDSDNPDVAPPELEWMDSIRQMLHRNQATAGGSSCRCIYHIPQNLRRGDANAYCPLVVALGPLQPRQATMKIVEAQKWCYLRELLSAAGDVDDGLRNLIQEIKKSEQRARECYSESFDHNGSDEFVNMMVVDGCFILQIILKETKRRPISSHDPIFHQRWLFHKVKRDLMLLPSQIPFFVLDRLFSLLAPSMGITVSLLSVVHDFFKDRIKGASLVVDDKPKHLLHILHLNLFPDVDCRKATPSFTNLIPFPGAVHLLEAGVQFESSRTDRLDVTFKGGVLKIPHFSIQDDTKSLFLNLMALEQLHPICRPRVTAYTFFMHFLINTAEDVTILCRKGVLDNWLDSNQEVTDLFGELSQDITVYPNEVYMADVIEGIHNHCNKKINACRGSFMQNYVRKPWGLVSLTAATILLILTLIEAFFSMFSYFRPPS